jgi:hypothetical protein
MRSAKPFPPRSQTVEGFLTALTLNGKLFLLKVQRFKPGVTSWEWLPAPQKIIFFPHSPTARAEAEDRDECRQDQDLHR